MKILCITSRVPWPLEKGDKLRIYHQLRELSKHHEVCLFAINDAPLHPDALAELGSFCKAVKVHRHTTWRLLLNLIRSLLNGSPFQVGYFTSASALRSLSAFAKQHPPDVIYCQLIRTAEYRQVLPDAPALLDYMDVFSKGVERRIPKEPWWKRWVFRLELKRLLRYEADSFRNFERHTIISRQDRDLLPFKEASAVTVVPNGVDTERFHPISREKDYEILFNGNMAYPPNVEGVVFLVKEVLPMVWKQRPDVRLLISGADPSPEVRALAGDRVTVTGWVDDVRESFSRSKMLVAPMKLSIGLQNKLLEAMAMKVPCITTSLSNNALGGKDGDELLLASTSEEFAQQIIRLLDDHGLSERIADNALRLVNTRYGWQESVKLLETELAGAVSNRER